MIDSTRQLLNDIHSESCSIENIVTSYNVIQTLIIIKY